MTRRYEREEIQKFADSFDIPNETQYPGIERLFATEIPIMRQWQFLCQLKATGTNIGVKIPDTQPADAEVQKLTEAALGHKKGQNHTAALVDLCDFDELPKSIADFLKQIYADFPKPEAVPIPPVTAVAAAASAGPTPPPAQPSEDAQK